MGRRDRVRRTPQIGRKSCANEPRKRPLTAAPPARLTSARKCATCRAFFMAKASYTAKDITVLEGLEPVRLRPGMYIGSTGPRGLHQLVYEVIDNAVDEALAGRADTIEMTIHPDNSVTVTDNGSGIPVDVMAEQGLPALTVVLTKLHAGGKFGGEGYKVSGGLHGVGVSVVNALSEWLHVEVHRDGKIYRQEFARGEPTTELEDGRRRQGHGHDDHLPARRRRLRGARVVDRDARPAPARDRVPDQGPADRPLRRARRRREARVPLRGRDPRLRRAREQGEGPGPQGDRLLRGRERPGQRRGGDAVELLVPGVGLLVRQQHQHHRGRLAPVRLQGRPDAHAQRLRPREGPAQGEGGQPRGRGRARGPGRGALGQAARPAVRGPDEDEARQPVGARVSSSRPSTSGWPSTSRRTRATRSGSSTRRSRRRERGRRRARRAS